MSQYSGATPSSVAHQGRIALKVLRRPGNVVQVIEP